MATKAVNSSYRLHRGSGQAVVTLKGQTYYLGKYGSQESKEKYHRLIAESMVCANFGVKKDSIAVAEAVVKFLEYAREYYADGNEYTQNIYASRPLINLYPSLRLADFGIPELEVVRNWWIERGCSRNHINKMVRRVVRMAKWWAGKQLADPSIHHALKCVEPLKKGRCKVYEPDPITPVSDADVDAAVKFMPKVVADMVRLQRLIGCRPGELVQIKPAMVDTSGDVWTITISDHKNAWRGKDRIIAVGPKAQAILKPYLDRGLSEYCFSPKEAMQQRDEARHKARKTSMSCGNKPGTNKRARPRKDSECYTTGTYGNAIRYACKRAKIEPWSPNQLRHAAATHLRKLEGIEAASVILGHSQLNTTEIYAEKNFQAAIVVARKHG
jgi:integrase